MQATSKNTYRVLIGVTGSVAGVKLIELIKELKSNFSNSPDLGGIGALSNAIIYVRIVMTKNAYHFVPKRDLIETFKGDSSIEIYDDDDEWALWKKMSDPVLHIELRKWADLLLIAPIDANTMAKLSNGICDNLLTSLVRAWDCSKPLIYCPAMNVHMYNHPLTGEHLNKLASFGYLRVDAVEKKLACGDIGMGGMATTKSIVEKVIECLLKA